MQNTVKKTEFTPEQKLFDINLVAEKIFDALRNNKITFEIFAVLVSIIIALPVYAQQQVQDCNEDEIDVAGENFLPGAITANEIKQLYVLVCKHMEGEKFYDESSVSLIMEPTPEFDYREYGFNDLLAYAYSVKGRNRRTGLVQIAAGSTSLSRDGVAYNEDYWRQILTHEFSHLFGATDDEITELLGMLNAIWWNRVTIYAATNQCNSLEQTEERIEDSEFAIEVCEDMRTIVNES